MNDEPPPGRWRRTYRPGPFRVAAAVVAMVAAAYVVFLSLLVLGTRGDAARLAYAAGSGVVVLLLGWTVVRALRVGVWVSERGLREVRLTRTTAWAWHRIRAVEVIGAPVPLLGVSPRLPGLMLRIHLHAGPSVDTVLTDRGADFLGRAEAFDVAATTVVRWWEAPHPPHPLHPRS